MKGSIISLMNVLISYFLLSFIYIYGKAARYLLNFYSFVIFGIF